MDVKDFDKIIIGIDPGTNVMGYGVLGIKGKKPMLIALGVIKLSKFESHYLRLRRIYDRVLGLVEQYLPDEMAIEAPFFGKNVQSMLKLGRAQGVAMAAALSRDIPIVEYEPRKSRWQSQATEVPQKNKSEKCFDAFFQYLYHSLMNLNLMRQMVLPPLSVITTNPQSPQ